MHVEHNFYLFLLYYIFRARLCVWIALTNILFIDESMAVPTIFWIYCMELVMDSI